MKPQMKTVSSKAYAKKGGNACPVCGSESYEGGSVEIEGSEAFQPLNCIDCGAAWTDKYVLVGYVDLETGDLEQ